MDLVIIDREMFFWFLSILISDGETILYLGAVAWSSSTITLIPVLEYDLKATTPIIWRKKCKCTRNLVNWNNKMRKNNDLF